MSAPDWWLRLSRRGRVTVTAAAWLAALAVEVLVWKWDTYWAQYVVQNMLPPSVWTLVGIGIAHLRSERRHDERHEDMKQHVTATAAPKEQG